MRFFKRKKTPFINFLIVLGIVAIVTLAVIVWRARYAFMIEQINFV